MSNENNKNTGSNIYSVGSDELNNEMLKIKRRNEQFAYIIGVLSELFWALNTVQLKTYEPNFPKAFSNNSLVFWRSLPIWGLGYYFCKKKDIRIKPISEIKYKFWFLVRSFGNYIGIWLWIKTLSYLRISTSQVITGCFPIVVIFLSIIILHESFYFRYIIGVAVCIFGSAIIVLNEKKPEARHTAVNDNYLLGLFFAILHVLFEGLSNLGQKIMCKEDLKGDLQNYYMGMYNALPAFILCIFEMHFGFSSFIYIIYAISNGLIFFYIANYLQAWALEYIAVAKFMPITYMCTVFIFLLGVIILHEPLYFTDVVGAVVILGFQCYNFYYPPGRQVDEEFVENELNNSKESNIILETIDEKALN